MYRSLISLLSLVTPINALSKKTNNYLPSEPQNQIVNAVSSISVSQSANLREEGAEKKRSSSTSRRDEPEYMKKLEPVKSSISNLSGIPSQRKFEEEKSSNSVNTSLNNISVSSQKPVNSVSSSNLKSSPYLSKENKPGMIFSNNSSTPQLTKEEEEQQQQLNNLINDAKELEKRKLNPGKKDTVDDDYFEEDEHSRVRATYDFFPMTNVIVSLILMVKKSQDVEIKRPCLIGKGLVLLLIC
jgi:hypothetical protein